MSDVFCKIYEWQCYQCLVVMLHYWDDTIKKDVNKITVTICIGGFFTIDEHYFKSLKPMESFFRRYNDLRAQKEIMESFYKAPSYCKIDL